MSVKRYDADWGGIRVQKGKILKVSFEPDERCVPFARTVAERALGHWGMAALVDDAKLIVSELVTNAVRQETTITLELTADSGALGIEVTDESPEVPEVPSGDVLFAEGGRGLLLVRCLAKEWGVHWKHGVPGHPPKTVWAVLAK